MVAGALAGTSECFDEGSRSRKASNCVNATAASATNPTMPKTIGRRLEVLTCVGPSPPGITGIVVTRDSWVVVLDVGTVKSLSASRSSHSDFGNVATYPFL